MANSLLDFVMSLVRDPDAAARYAADPSQAIADADLTDVTSTDVNNLIPMVSESLSMTTPATGVDAFGVDPSSNVWSSGAATAAFDAFADRVPDARVDDVHTLASGVIDQPDPARQAGIDSLTVAGAPADREIEDASLQFDGLVVDNAPTGEALPAEGSDDIVTESEHVDDGGSGFDIFD